MNLEKYRSHYGKVADALAPLGLHMPAFRLYEWLNSLGDKSNTADPSLPPAYYRVLTTGIADLGAYLDVGRRAAGQIVALAESSGAVLDAQAQVLEFGCGCGRVLRYLAEMRPVRLHGCDIHAGMVKWCAQHLPGQYAVNGLAPPLPYSAASFDLVYALSVFTHLTRANAERWLEELGRVVRPGGLAILSFWDEHGEPAAPFADELSKTGFHLKRGGSEGSNLMVGFFTHEAFAAVAAPAWERVTSIASTESPSHQAMMVLRRRTV